MERKFSKERLYILCKRIVLIFSLFSILLGLWLSFIRFPSCMDNLKNLNDDPYGIHLNICNNFDQMGAKAILTGIVTLIVFSAALGVYRYIFPQKSSSKQ